ncbi:MAG: 5'-Nucleotidase-like protein [Methanothrix harundinacea]|uniref:5'-Nucleotidase-like protein n=1 Tax=Methanothrix harundinacea TaxID=301375 RepID=A0A101FWB7_9EURY|nr:MAG: 5'-Nucleotidase-like protein [Methanothrix harundinacea]KUK97053.1 MAG: 5'-Nucleotidase-like protein [Methanothrix harundinacea]
MTRSTYKTGDETSRSLFPGFCLSVLIAVLLTDLAISSPDPSENETLEVQILAINDLCGHLQPPQGTVKVGYNSSSQPVQLEAGGVEYLATHIKGLKATNPETILVSAGDNIGASPLISALFHDEPTIEALSLMGFDYSAAGNHEFDEGASELLRMQYGCCNPATGCQDGDRFVGAGFEYLTANVVIETTNETLFPPYAVRNVQGIPVAFIGVSLKSTPSVVVPSGVEGLKFIDEAEAVNGCVEVLKGQGVETIVVLVHNGGLSAGLPNEGMNPCEAIEDIVNRTDDEVDLFITGHSRQAYIAEIDGRPVTQAGLEGNFITDIDLVISLKTKDVVEVRAKNVAVTRDVPKDPAVSLLLEKYADLVGPLANKVTGSVTADISKTSIESGESPLGDLIADAQLCATSCNESAVVALTNPGGIRTSILFNKISGDEKPGEVTYQEAFDVQPFGNSLTVMNLTGEQIDMILEEQFDNPGPGQNRILQVSRGFTYAWCESAPTGSKVDISNIKIDGTPIDPNQTYRVAANFFLAEGGDGFVTLKEGVDRICGITDLEALVNYLKENSPVSPPPMGRISFV